MQVAGIDIVGDLPAELNKTIVYGTGLTTMAKQPDAAKALVKYLSLELRAGGPEERHESGVTSQRRQ